MQANLCGEQGAAVPNLHAIPMTVCKKAARALISRAYAGPGPRSIQPRHCGYVSRVRSRCHSPALAPACPGQNHRRPAPGIAVGRQRLSYAGLERRKRLPTRRAGGLRMRQHRPALPLDAQRHVDNNLGAFEMKLSSCLGPGSVPESDPYHQRRRGCMT